MSMMIFKSQGIILIVVLWLLVILSALALGFGHSMLVEYRITTNDMDRIKTMELAKSGVERSIAVLATDSTEKSTINSPWRAGTDSFQNVALGDGTYSIFYISLAEDNQPAYGMVDENSKLNLNTVTKEQLMKLPGVDEIIADSIIDWRSPTAKASAFGAKDEYYTQLNPPYKCKNGPFDSVEELLMVKGVTPQLLFGEDANHNGIMDANENDGDQSFPPDNADGQLDRGLYPYLTVYSYDPNQALDGTRRTNINTASQRQMRRLTQFGLTNQDITNIMNYRNRNRSFKNSGELLNVSGMNYTKYGKVADYITMNDREKEVGLVNINTAPRTVLIALFEGSEEKSQKVLDYRNGTDAAYKDMGTLAKSLGNSAYIPISDKVTLRSSQFTIQSLGRLSDKKAYTRLLVVVDRALIPIKTLYFRDISYMGAGI